MISIGTIGLTNSEQVIGLRKKIKNVAEILSYGKMNATKMASLISDTTRYLLTSSSQIDISILLKSTDFDQLCIQFISHNSLDLSETNWNLLDSYFDSLQKVKNEDHKNTILLGKYISHQHSGIDETLIRQLKSIVSHMSENELLKELETKNKALSEAYQQLERSKSELIERVQQIASIGGWEVNLKDMSTEWTEGVYLIHELSETNDTNVEKGLNFYAPEAQPIIAEAVGKAISDGINWDLELPFITHKGNHRWVRTIGYPVQVNGVTVRLSGIIQDITRRKLAEIEMKEAHSRLELATTKAAIGIWDWDVRNNVLLWNEVMYELYGVKNTNANMVDYKVWVNGVHPEDRTRSEKEIERALSGESPFNTEFRIVWPDQSIHYIKAVATVQRDENGAPIRMIGTNWNITKEKEAERARIRAEKLQIKNKELENFAYIASHDLQEPLRTVTNYTGLISEDYGEHFDEEGKKVLGYINSATNRMSTLIKGLLDYSRIGKSRMLVQINCTDLVTDVVNDLRTVLEEADAKVNVHPLPEIIGYETEIRLLFQNLISNATKFRKDDLAPEINIRANDSATYWQFEVEDNGIGIDEKHKEKIFKIFQRLHVREKFEGTGIGLAHCRKIIELHNGDIWVHSELNSGSTFYFTIGKSIRQVETETDE